jgi:FMNH2-dependent dimethyl sulfone monooxygenase
MPSPSKGIRYGSWMPVFGGWLRNVEDENMQATWPYVSRLAQRSEELGFDLSLIAELNLNHIKGVNAPRSMHGPLRPRSRL